MKKFFLIVGILVVVGFLVMATTISAAVFGRAQKCPATAGQVRSDKELLRLLETKGLTLTDAEATALIQKPLSGKVEDARVCFTPGLAHLSGNIKLGRLSPSFYISTGVDLSGASPKTKNFDIKLGGIPNIFLFTPLEKMAESIINDNLSKAKFEEKFTIELNEASVTIKKIE